MANITITRGNTLPDSSAKSDFHNLIDQASAAITGIVNADVDGSAAIAGTKISPDFGSQNITTTGTVSGTGTVPAGTLLPYGGSSAPTGYLLAYGQAVSRTTYSALFAVVGTSFGAGDSSTTFNVPDMRGRIIAGLDNLGGSSANRITAAAADTVGGATGEETHELTIGEMPAHTHAVGTANNVAGPGDYDSINPSGDVASGETGGSQSHNNLQPTLFSTWIIKI